MKSLVEFIKHFRAKRALSYLLLSVFSLSLLEGREALSLPSVTSHLNTKETNNFTVAKAKKKRKRVKRSSKKSRSLTSKRKALSKKKKREKKRKITKKRASRRRRLKGKRRKVSSLAVDLRELKALMREEQYLKASEKAFSMMSNSKFSSRKIYIRYLLGKIFYKMNLNQAAAFQFANVIKSGKVKFLKKSLRYLYLSANNLEDHALLDYALSKIQINDFPKNKRGLLYFRLGNLYRDSQNFDEAVRFFSLVPSKSSFYYKAQYLKALSFAETKEDRKALRVFDRLYDSRALAPKNDRIRAVALIGRARVLYQSKNWRGATRAYKNIPKDIEVWHDSLSESSWTFLRQSKFRSALGPLLSLHSSFYENFYSPESLLLRSIIYLYICKYDEINKTLGLFQKVYRTLQKDIDAYLKDVKNPLLYFNDTVKALEGYQSDSLLSIKYPISPLLADKISRSGIFQKNYLYVKNLFNEKKQLQTMPYRWRKSYVGKYAQKIVNRRLNKARVHAGKRIKNIMEFISVELLKLFEQEGLIRYEVTNSQREFLKEKIQKKKKTSQIDSDTNRSFYIQNGFEYWSFKGEFWLDEIGNYYYLGRSSCQIQEK